MGAVIRQAAESFTFCRWIFLKSAIVKYHWAIACFHHSQYSSNIRQKNLLIYEQIFPNTGVANGENADNKRDLKEKILINEEKEKC